MSIQVIKIPRATDRAVIRVFVDLAKQFKIPTFSGNAVPFSPLGDFQVGQEPAGLWKQVLDQDSETLDSVTIGISGQSVTYQRGGGGGPEGSPIWDELRFNNVQQCPIDVKIGVADFLVRRLRPYDPKRVTVGLGVEAQEQSLAIHNATLQRLEAVGATIAEQTLQTRNDLERMYQDKVQTRMAELDAERELLKREHATRAAELDQRAADIDQKVKAVDDRSNTHARREIRDKMLDEVKQRVTRFDVSQSTKHKRIPVEIAMLVFIVAIATMLVYTIKEASGLSARSEQAVSMLAIAIDARSGAAVDERAVLLKDATTTLSRLADDKVPMYWLWARSAFLLVALAAAFI